MPLRSIDSLIPVYHTLHMIITNTTQYKHYRDQSDYRRILMSHSRLYKSIWVIIRPGSIIINPVTNGYYCTFICSLLVSPPQPVKCRTASFFRTILGSSSTASVFVTLALYTHTHTHTCTHIHVHTYTHTYTHTYIHEVVSIAISLWLLINR